MSIHRPGAVLTVSCEALTDVTATAEVVLVVAEVEILLLDVVDVRVMLKNVVEGILVVLVPFCRLVVLDVLFDELVVVDVLLVVPKDVVDLPVVVEDFTVVVASWGDELLTVMAALSAKFQTWLPLYG